VLDDVLQMYTNVGLGGEDPPFYSDEDFFAAIRAKHDQKWLALFNSEAIKQKKPEELAKVCI
jgi:hypothetical protein